MKRGLAILLSAIVVIAVLGALIAAGAKTMEQPLVRIAELEIDAGQVEAYTNALREEIETSVRVEPGVPALYAVSVKGQPNQIRIFETYKDAAAYANRIYKRHTSRSTKLRLKVW
jgi:quinol monooxygenase YgiN